MQQNVKTIKTVKSVEFINTLYKIISENVERKEGNKNDTK